jgi:ribosomal protein S18 acetylase RimI-like enzyme
MNGFVIRTFSPEDEKQIIDLWEECNLVVPWNDPKKDIIRKVKHSPQHFFVGVFEKEIISTCMAAFDGHRGWIYYLAVKPEYRRKGFGKAMVNHAEKVLIEEGCPKIDLMVRENNREVISFYENYGYNSESVVVMSKRLEEDK